MISVSRQPNSFRPMGARSIFGRIQSVVTWPFTNRYAAPLWLALRLYLASIWFQFGWAKLTGGWLTSDPLALIFKPVISGALDLPIPAARGLFAFLVEAGITPYVSFAMPFLELAVALALISGVMVVPASIGAIMLVGNIFLSGSGTLAFDGRVIALHILLILAYRVVSVIGVERLLVRMINAARQQLRLRLARPAPAR